MELFLENVNAQILQQVIGVNDKNLKLLESLYQCDIAFRNDTFYFLSEDINLFNKFNKHIEYLFESAKNNTIDVDFIKRSFNSLDTDNNYLNKIIGYSINGKPYKCKTLMQFNLINNIKNHDLIFAVGPAGTGKTFLAVLCACQSFKKGDVERIIITRPAVEAGESLGFLPGDLKEKIDPYLMPIYDALDEILGKEQKDKLIEKGAIEVMPLAYMRGRTLNKAFIILDEAQNTTDKQMLMFLTRLGYNSKMIVNGDITQIDLNITRNKSGLVTAIEKLININEVSFIEFSNSDVVRNPLVQKIIESFQV